jgi:excisionase family DNA binding protein
MRNMQLTPQDLWTLRNIAIRAINECHEVFTGAARIEQAARRNEDAQERSRQKRREQAPTAQSAHRQALDKPAPGARPVAVERLAYSVKEAAAAIGISVASIWRHISEGRLETFKLGGRRLIPAASLRALLEAAQEPGRQ